MAYQLTHKELSELRTAIALCRANYNRQPENMPLLMQLIDNADDHIFALRTIIQALLSELDGEKRDAGEMLETLVEVTAIADARS